MMRRDPYRRIPKMEWQEWMVRLTTHEDGSVELRSHYSSTSKLPVELLSGTYIDLDVLFQELLTLLDSSIWSFLATRQVAQGQPTLGGYAG